MKYYFLKFSGMVIIMLILTSAVIAQNQDKIKGTIGNEKLGNDRIVVCVYGTAACMPVNVDSTMTVKYNGAEMKLAQLPFGLYIEAQIERDVLGKNILTEITIDQDKTVICFTKLNEGQEKQLSELLATIDGVKSFKLIKKSKQVFIKFNHNIISYQTLEDQIKKAGFELE